MKKTVGFKSAYGCIIAAIISFFCFGAGSVSAEEISLDQVVSQPTEIILDNVRIQSLTVSGSVNLEQNNSLVRIILVDENQKEYLVYETYSLVADGMSADINNECQETCNLSGVVADRLVIDVVNAEAIVDSVNYEEGEGVMKSAMVLTPANTEYFEKIQKINQQLLNNGFRWKAGETEISKLSWQKKKQIMGETVLRKFPGIEFYKGGIIDIAAGGTLSAGAVAVPEVAATSDLIEEFDWRNRHGVNNPESPYYDNDTQGNGWYTEIKSQSCNHCWVFGTVATMEATINLYYNQHLDIDLSEQEGASCSGGNSGNCEGGYGGRVVSYIQNNGIADEACMPYMGLGAEEYTCGNRCAVSDELFKVPSYTSVTRTEEDIKRAVIKQPIVAALSSMWHLMSLSGFKKDEEGNTVWIFKNSWGADSGDNGFLYATVEDISDFNTLYSLDTPIQSQNTDHQIICQDADNDGLYNWGISEEVPASCPAGINTTPDCDDSDASLGAMDENGFCISTFRPSCTFATIAEHKQEGRVYSEITTINETCYWGWCFGGEEVETFYTEGSQENLGTDSSVEISLKETADGYFVQGECDDEVPVIEVSDVTVNEQTVIVTGTAYDIDGSVAQIKADVSGNVVVCDGAENWTCTFESLEAGLYTVSIIAIDSDNLESDPDYASFTVPYPELPPEIVDHTARVDRTTLQIYGNASDVNDNIESVAAIVNDVIYICEGTNYYNCNINNLQRGVSYQVYLRAFDSAGNSSEDYGPIEQYIGYAPVIDEASVNAVVNGSSVTITGSASDVDGDMAAAIVYFQGGGLQCTGMAADFNCQLSVTQSGTYQAQVKVVDVQMNDSNIVDVEFTIVDVEHNPILSVSGWNANGDTFTANGTASDEDGDLDRVELTGLPTGTLNCGTGFNCSVTGLGAGTYNLYLTAYDSNGNASDTYGPMTFTVEEVHNCVTATNYEHVNADPARAISQTSWWTTNAVAVGSGDSLGSVGSQWYSVTTSLEETSSGYWEKVDSCQ
ncbi:MAG: hypothetical protein D6B27_05845 [Gammaproteobacteria bacterium]|nr:MAG: hypothetical protein D6B27_05845 [Gammaproteobacteria bacterium]